MIIISEDKTEKIVINDTNFDTQHYVEMYGKRDTNYKIEGADPRKIYTLGYYKNKKEVERIYKEILKFIQIKPKNYIYEMPKSKVNCWRWRI